jgi:hypothetical protein
MTESAEQYTQIIRELQEQRQVSRDLTAEVAANTSALAAMGTRLDMHMEWSKAAHAQRDINCAVHRKETDENTAWKEKMDGRMDDIVKALAGFIAVGTFLMLFRDGIVKAWGALFR